MTKFEELMENQKFVESLENTESFDDVKAAFESNGVDLTEELDLNNIEEEELSEIDLDDVAGGVSTADLKRILKRSISIVSSGKVNPFKTAWKYGKSCGILLKAYYDVQRYNNATRTYSEKQIMDAARYIGCA